MAFGTSKAAIAILMLVAAGPAAAQKLPQAPAPKIFEDVFRCRAVTDERARLACYDRSVGTLETAQRANEIYVADKEGMKDVRRGLFGFSVPKLKIFGDEDLGDLEELETTIAAIGQGARGYVFTLPDGARWAQSDKKYIDKPKVGAKIRIKKAMLGSYMASINKKPGFRVERISN